MIALDRVALKIERSKRYVFERKDFEGIASYAQVGLCPSGSSLKAVG